MFISTGVSLLGAQAAGGGLPDVYTTGLQAWWDFGEPTSYPGTGTTIFDLSGNGNDGTLSAGMAFTSSFGGGGYMANTVDKVYISSNFLASTKNWSVCIFGNYHGYNQYDRIWSGIMNGDSGDLGYTNTTTARMIGSGGSQGYWNNLPAGSFDQDILNMYSYQCDNRNPFLRSYWKNKTEYAVTNATASATSQIEAVEGFTWGGYDQLPGTNAVTGISYVALIYNTNLVQANIDQNYDAYKVRFGLP